MKSALKPFVAIQRVRLPPGKGVARQPEASLAWPSATAVVKRRQRVMKRRCKPRYHDFLTMPSACWVRGQYLTCRNRRGRRDRPGSWTAAKSQDGSPGNLRDPAHAHTGKAGTGAPADTKAPGPTAALPAGGSATANTNTQGRVDPEGEGISRRACGTGSRSTLIVPAKTGNRVQRDPEEERGVPRNQNH